MQLLLLRRNTLKKSVFLKRRMPPRSRGSAAARCTESRQRRCSGTRWRKRRAAAPTNKHILSFVRLHSSTIFKISQKLKSVEGFRTMKRLTQKLRERRPAHCCHRTRQVESGLEVSRNVSSHLVNPVNAVLLLP